MQNIRNFNKQFLRKCSKPNFGHSIPLHPWIKIFPDMTQYSNDDHSIDFYHHAKKPKVLMSAFLKKCPKKPTFETPFFKMLAVSPFLLY